MWRAAQTKRYVGTRMESGHSSEWSIWDGNVRVARVQGANGEAERKARLIVDLYNKHMAAEFAACK